jgi:hypothetical protein
MSSGFLVADATARVNRRLGSIQAKAIVDHISAGLLAGNLFTDRRPPSVTDCSL